MKSRNIVNEPNCPACGVSWIGNPIPDDLKKEYGNKSHFPRIVEVRDWKTNKITAYECPDCEESFRIPQR